MYTSEHDCTLKKAERSMQNVQEAVSEEVMLPSTMPISPTGMFCFCFFPVMHHSVENTKAQDMTLILPQTTVFIT